MRDKVERQQNVIHCKITMYTSRRALHSAVVDKVNQELGWSVKNIEELKFNISNLETARQVGQVIDQLKICDLAVGEDVIIVTRGETLYLIGF